MTVVPATSTGAVQQASSEDRAQDPRVIALSGALAGFLAGVVVCPLDVAKTRLQAQGTTNSMKYHGITGTLSTIVKEEGVRGLYRGVVPIVLGYFPTWMIYFSVYERAKRVYPKILGEYGIDNEFVTHSLSAFTAGGASSIVTNPIWVVKTRLMLQTGDGKSTYNNKVYYRGTIDAFKKMYKNEGLLVFSSGLVPSLFGLFHVAIHFPVYEELKKLFKCDQQVDHRLPRLIAASALSKMCASTLTYPHEILRTRMQIRTINRNKHSLIMTIVKIWRKEGFFGFYSGFTTNLARTVPASAVTLVSFEYISRYFACKSFI
ncbi:mitochondrial carrier [Cyberlindnera jadinii NRRL Y-1542]|uniref:Mitochondrial carrier n=1 Tax=Cyberlindnera jadinii (strain ATCC 18201 / CBS 1600 / BCRC 20928 / JCM 3617 / NBRC 0987 / NRRL Y-1542) TaxID=983966 RepID=A0A1E4RXH6_CYBJN|nr:mitochondrial carrier [Cyberlindnera jadinii NRRL Y-1542]ODV71973.1 mitochondrial carrier [Cyberlindnera jadinii NRRL Y-1542]